MSSTQRATAEACSARLCKFRVCLYLAAPLFTEAERALNHLSREPRLSGTLRPWWPSATAPRSTTAPPGKAAMP